MNNVTLHAPAQTPRFAGTIVSMLMTAMLVVAGALSLAQFAG